MPTSSRKKVAASTSTPNKQTRSSRRSSTRGNKAKDKEEEVLDDASKNNDAPISSAEELKGSNNKNEKADSTEPQLKKTEQIMEDGDSKPAAVDQSQANMNNNNMMIQQQPSNNNQYLPSNAYMGSNYMGMMNNFSPMAMSNDPAMQAAMMQMMQNNGGGGSFNYPQAVVQTSAAEAKNFPETLFDVLSEEDTNHIVSWLAHGKGFMITDKQAFAKVLLPKYFDGCKFTSFTRRLKRWNFERVARGPEIGAYYNPLFQRDNPEWVLKMRYRMDDSQFANAKAQSQDKMPDVVVNNNIPIPEDQMHEYQQNYVLSSKISSQTREFFANGPADVLPLPSSLPKRVKKNPSTPPLDNPQRDEEMRMMELQQQMIMSRSMQSQSVAASGMPSLPGIPQAYDPANNPPETQQQGGLKTVLMTNEEQKSYLEYKAMKQNGEV